MPRLMPKHASDIRAALEPYRDIDIKFIGARKGERLNEPLWLKEENPKATKYPKILQLENIEYDEKRLDPRDHVQ